MSTAATTIKRTMSTSTTTRDLSTKSRNNEARQNTKPFLLPEAYEDVFDPRLSWIWQKRDQKVNQICGRQREVDV
jgi:hypothetical protein